MGGSGSWLGTSWVFRKLNVPLLRILAVDHTPVYARIPVPDPDGTSSLTIRLTPGREVSVWKSLQIADSEYHRGAIVRDGLRNGDTAVRVGSRSIDSQSELESALDVSDSAQPLVLWIRRGGEIRPVSLTPPWREPLKKYCFVTR